MNASPILCDIHLPLSWGFVERVRRQVGEKLAGYDESLRDAAVMVASELAENIVKYGEPLDGRESGRIQVAVDGKTMRIVSTSGARSAASIEKLRDQLRLLAETEDPEALYLSRMRELLENPTRGEAQMGLYRIACEGGFRLSHGYRDGVLTIAAERVL